MKRELWRPFLSAAPEGTRKRSKLRRITIPAVVIALPLLAFGYLLSGWLDADDIVKRRAAQERANAEAQRIEATVLAALDAKSRAVFDRIDVVRREVNPNDHLRQMIYSREVSYVLIRRGTELLFPSTDDWTFPDIEDQRRQLLSLAADLYSRMDPPQGWYAGLSGIVFFRCNRAEIESVCFALDEAALRPDLVAALDAAAKQSPDWAFVLRDSYNRNFWRSGPDAAGVGGAFAMSGALRGWTLHAAALAPATASPVRIVALIIPLALFWVYFVSNLNRRQLEQLAEAERKKAFLDKIAHDLRTPLANLKLFCELVAQESRGNARAEDHCAILSAEVDRLDQVAANAMAFGRASAPQMRASTPDDILQSTLERFSPRFAACRTTCTIMESETAPLLYDVAAYERILVNLLDNACKYAPGAVSVTTHFDAGMLRLEVRDNGPGLPNSEGVQPSGSGLGLSIVQDLTKANGGSVSLINGQQGLRVIVTLKARLVEGEAGEAAGC
jgi:signal transduction histidine kinase